MAGLDHVAFDSADPDAAAAFHEPGGPGDHVAVRVGDEERKRIKQRLDEPGVEWAEHDHGVAVGLFFRDPNGSQLEAITYPRDDDPRRP